MWGPAAKDAKFQYSHGPAEKGSIMAFLVEGANNRPVLTPVWMSREMHVPDPPAIANGVVFGLATGENTMQLDKAIGYEDLAGAKARMLTAKERATPVSNAILYAFDAATGQELYSSGKLIESWTHFSGIAIAGGHVYVSTWDARVYAFGIRE
jgi:outer membrane protein assembly factor BamB